MAQNWFGNDMHQEDEVVLELKNVTKRFGDVLAVDDVSLKVQRGEVVTLLGPDGCGKTSTLRMIVGLERLTDGEILYGGDVMESSKDGGYVPAHKRNMGIVFQSYAIWPHKTVAENVAYPLKVRRVRGREMRERVSEVLDMVGLGAMEKQPAFELTAAQRQRVALARAIVFKPDLVLLDEPFASLQVEFRDAMRTELRELQRKLGLTIIFVTHDKTEALSLSDRIALMEHGKIEQVGTPFDLYRDPKSPVVRDSIGKTVMLDGYVSELMDDDTVAIHVGGDFGALVHAQVSPLGGLQVGKECLIAFRPEAGDVEPLETAVDSDAPGVLRGVISTLLFTGDKFEARIELPWGGSMSLHLPAEDRWREGQPVAVRFSPEKLQAWPAGAVVPDRRTLDAGDFSQRIADEAAIARAGAVAVSEIGEGEDADAEAGEPETEQDVLLTEDEAAVLEVADDQEEQDAPEDFEDEHDHQTDDFLEDHGGFEEFEPAGEEPEQAEQVLEAMVAEEPVPSYEQDEDDGLQADEAVMVTDEPTTDEYAVEEPETEVEPVAEIENIVDANMKLLEQLGASTYPPEPSVESVEALGANVEERPVVGNPFALDAFSEPMSSGVEDSEEAGLSVDEPSEDGTTADEEVRSGDTSEGLLFERSPFGASMVDDSSEESLFESSPFALLNQDEAESDEEAESA